MRRVVITGLGAVTPVGNTVDEMWQALIEGKNGIDFIKQFDTKFNKVKIAGEVKDLKPEMYLDFKEYKRQDPAFIFGMVAAAQAYNDSNLQDPFNHDRFGVYMTSGIGGLNTIFQESFKIFETQSDRVSPFFVPNSIVNLIGGNVAIKYQAKGSVVSVVTACASGTNAIGEAFRAIRDGYMDICLTGGAEAPVNGLGVSGFTAMRALNMSNDPQSASIPFDKRRSGFVMGEGAGALMLEELSHAKKRGAKIYAEVAGYFSNCDAFHMTAPDETATGISNCIKGALEDANISPEDIDYINAHGTSTPLNDKYETLGMKVVFKDHAYRVSISSTKSMLGHSLGATGAIESIICIKAITDGIIPPTINYQVFDEECDLNYTPNVAVKKSVRFAMNNNLGFGGHNASIIFKEYKESE